MSLRIKDKVRKIRRSFSWHTASNDGGDHLDGIRGSITHSSSSSFDTGLPEGWESAIDKDGRLYYINHKENISTYNDPRKQLDVEYEYAETRIITLNRDTQLGFGFVAGSERPVVVRCVSEGGPSDKLLLPGDQIHKINSEDVRDAPRSRVIELVRSAEQELILTVSQPPTISTQGKKSILLNAAKKQQRLKRDSSASRVRFTEEAVNKKKRVALPLNGSTETKLSNVLKVGIETNQTRSFKFDGFTLVKDVLHALQEKLGVRCIEHFGLVLHSIKSPLSAKMIVLSPNEKIKQVVSQLADESVQCLFRIVYVPRDAYDLLRKDGVAFQYFYTQCCQDVINERFSSDLKCDVALRLASLHMQEQAIEKQIPFHKITIKLVEREFGLGMFLNPSMLRAVRPKELRKMLGHFMKLNQGLIAPGQKQVTPLQAKLHYMKIVSELRSFGGKCFLATLVDRRAEVMLLVGPKCGISQVTDIKSFTLHMLADFDLIVEIKVKTEKSGATQLISVLLSDTNLPILALSMMNSDAKDFLTFVQGYHQLFCGTSDLIKIDEDHRNSITGPHTPPILSKTFKTDFNENDSVEPDYATIEDVLFPDGADGKENSTPNQTTPALPVKPDLKTIGKPTHVSVANVLPKRSKENDSAQNLSTTNCIIIGADDVDTPNMDGNPASSHKSITITTDIKPEHHYDISVEDGEDTEPPTSSIDDLIRSCSSVSSSSESTQDDERIVIPSTADSLTDECLVELNKLDHDGVILDPRMFKDKGVYINPQPIDLSVLPPPDENIPSPRSPPPELPPPPELFAASSSQEQADSALSEQMEAEQALNAPDGGDKESGIDSDDSGTETFNSTDNMSNLSGHSAFNIVSIPEVTVNTSTPTLQQQERRVQQQRTHAPASSLRSRLQEQRAKARELAESSAREDSVPAFSASKIDEPVNSGTHNVQNQKTGGDDSGMRSMLDKTEQSDIDVRMVDALMQFTNDLSTDSDSTDESDDEDTNGENKRGFSWDLSGDKPMSALPPMMLSDSHVDVSTEEEDNNDIGDTTLTADTQPTYMNSEVEAPVKKSADVELLTVTDAAIDEALDGLTSDSDEDSPVSIIAPDMNTRMGRRISSDTDKWSARADSVSPQDTPLSSPVPNTTDCKKVSATIVISPSSEDAAVDVEVADLSSLKVITTEPAPKPPPRKKRGMKASGSLASLSTIGGDRPPSRTSLNTMSSATTVTTTGDQSPRIMSRGVSLEQTSPRGVHMSPRPGTAASTTKAAYHRSVSACSGISGLSDISGIDHLSVSAASSLHASPRTPRTPSGTPRNHRLEHSPSGDAPVLRNKNNKKNKVDRASRTASVIGMPTNISCTAGDVLANCVPIVRADGRSPRNSQSIDSNNTSSNRDSVTSNVTLTSRESLLDEIIHNAQGLGIDTEGFSPSEVDAGVKRRDSNNHQRKSGRDSISSIESSRSVRPSIAPPPPPSSVFSRNSALRASRSEGDLLAATNRQQLSLTDSSTAVGMTESMLGVEYATLDEHTDLRDSSGVGISRHTSVVEADNSPTTNSQSPSSTLKSDSGLEKDGSFIKFQGYSGEPSALSPTSHRRGRFRKRGQPTSMISITDHVVGENQGKRGIMAKILSTIKPKKRSMSLDRSSSDSKKPEGGSLKVPTTTASRPTILPLGDKYSGKSNAFRSLGKTKFHTKPKLSMSLSELVYEHPDTGGIVITPARTQSVECLLEPTPDTRDVESSEVEELHTSGDKINPSGILHYTYRPHNAFTEAISHTDSLIAYFTAYCDTQWAPSLNADPHTFTKIKETLMSEGRQFVANSKQLVAGVAQASGPTDPLLVSKMAASVRTLAKIILEGVEALKVTTSDYNMTSLRECIVTVSEAYADVLQTSHKAAGKSIQDENMGSIMSRAAHLASLLSLYLKTLKALHETG